MGKLMEYMIHGGLDWTEADGLGRLRSIWRDVLCKDPHWHFFFEGDYTLIRCGGRFDRLLEKKLEGWDLTFERRGEWVDNIPITKKYQELFEAIFHSFSELAMRAEDAEITQLLDRVTHCFLNNCRTMDRVRVLESIGISNPAYYWESMLLSRAAIGRALTIGQIVGSR